MRQGDLDALLTQLSPTERQVLLDLQAESGGDLDALIKKLTAVAGLDWKWQPVSMEKFLLGKEYLNLQGKLFPRLVDDLVELFEGGYHEAVLCGGIGWGKALALDTPLPTPSGWTTMGEVAVGDLLYDEQGAACRVVKVTEVMHERPCYRVTFSDGTTIVADAEHQWATTTWNERRNAARSGRPAQHAIVTTEQIRATLKNRNMNNHAIALAGEVDGRGHAPIDPYVLGAWLGDGTSAEACLTSEDDEIPDQIRAAGYRVDKMKAAYRYSIKGPDRAHSFKAELRALGVLGNKHIPAAYLRYSKAVRLALLQGMLDTDGSVQPGGHVEFMNSNKALAEGVFELAASLSCKPTWAEERATLYDKDCGPRYRVSFTPDLAVFRVRRKAERLEQRDGAEWDPRNAQRYITAVDPVESVPVRCIEVDSPSHLFLSSRAFIPTHNSTFGECALARMVYEVSCLRDPQSAYGLIQGSKIAFINASVNKAQAQNVVFHGVKQKLLGSPYFRERFPFQADLTSEMRFPNDIWIAPVAASEGGTIGYNVFGGLLDEVNFWDVVEKSAHNRGGMYDQAQSVYTMLIRRMKSRFAQGGKLPGVLLNISSSKYPDDFTERRIAEVLQEQDKSTFVRRYSTWSTKPEGRHAKTVFYLSLGNASEGPQISRDALTFHGDEDAKVIEVPDDLWSDFEKDLDGAVRDLAGYPTLAVRPFLPQKDKLMAAIEKGRLRGLVHPYSVIETTLEDGAHLLPEHLKFDPFCWYFAHVDLALKKDACGVAVGHISRWTTVTRTADDGTLLHMSAPEVTIDLMLRIVAPKGGEIQVDYVRALLLELRERGCRFKKVTYDQYNSASSRQSLLRSGIESELLSVDKPMDAYNSFKESILEERLVLYPYVPLVEEVIRLEFNEKKNKVDHPPKSRKDVSDAVCGVVFHCSNEEVREMVLDTDADQRRVALEAANPEIARLLAIKERLEKKAGKPVDLTIDDMMFGDMEDDPADEGGFFGIGMA